MDVSPSALTVTVAPSLSSSVMGTSGARSPKFCVNSTCTTFRGDVWQTVPLS